MMFVIHDSRKIKCYKKKHEGSLIKIASPSARNDSGDKPFTSIYKGLISNTLSEFHGLASGYL